VTLSLRWEFNFSPSAKSSLSIQRFSSRTRQVSRVFSVLQTQNFLRQITLRIRQLFLRSEVFLTSLESKKLLRTKRNSATSIRFTFYVVNLFVRCSESVTFTFNPRFSRVNDIIVAKSCRKNNVSESSISRPMFSEVPSASRASGKHKSVRVKETIVGWTFRDVSSSPFPRSNETLSVFAPFLVFFLSDSRSSIADLNGKADRRVRRARDHLIATP